jgi:Cu/Ag efflux pump CusA
MLKPLAIAVIGALTLSVLLSLIATPTVILSRECSKNDAMTQNKTRNDELPRA